jgi:hypothetical protein
MNIDNFTKDNFNGIINAELFNLNNDDLMANMIERNIVNVRTQYLKCIQKRGFEFITNNKDSKNNCHVKHSTYAQLSWRELVSKLIRVQKRKADSMYMSISEGRSLVEKGRSLIEKGMSLIEEGRSLADRESAKKKFRTTLQKITEANRENERRIEGVKDVNSILKNSKNPVRIRIDKTNTPGLVVPNVPWNTLDESGNMVVTRRAPMGGKKRRTRKKQKKTNPSRKS